jgi:hypothetical protein
MREIDRVTVNGKTSIGMAFKTESAQSSWLPDQMLKKGGDIWRIWRKMGFPSALPEKIGCDPAGPTNARRIGPPLAVKSRIGADFRANHPLSQVQFGSSLSDESCPAIADG